MSASTFIAKRYFQARRQSGFLSFLTTIAIVGVMLGSAALIITLSVLDGFENEIKSKVVGFTSHIEIQGFQNQPLPDYRATIRMVQAGFPEISAIAPFASREGMIRSSTGIDGVLLKGIDPSHDILASRYHLVQGTFLKSGEAGKHQIVLSRRLADRLGLTIGRSCAVFVLPRQAVAEPSQPRAMQFAIAGLYDSGMAEFDDIFAYTDLTSAQQLFRLEDNVTGYDILVRDLSTIDTVAARLQEKLPYPHYVRTVFQLYRNLFSWVELQKQLSPILLALVTIVATVNIIGTLLMFVLEKLEAIAILQSLGAGPRLIRRIFTIQGLIIGIIGVILGNLLAWILCIFQLQYHVISIPSEIYYMDAAPILLRWQNFALVTVITMLLCLLTTRIPARIAASIKAVTAFRFG